VAAWCVLGVIGVMAVGVLLLFRASFFSRVSLQGVMAFGVAIGVVLYAGSHGLGVGGADAGLAASWAEWCGHCGYGLVAEWGCEADVAGVCEDGGAWSVGVSWVAGVLGSVIGLVHAAGVMAG